MNTKHLLTLAVALLPLLGLARSASPDPVTVTSANGTKTEVRGYGDAGFNYFTDLQGTVVLEKDAQGNWNPAVRGGRTLRPVESDLRLLAAEQASTLKEAETRMAPINKNNGQTLYPTITEGNEVHSLVVLLEYSDTPFTVPEIRKAIDDMLNLPGYNAYGSCGSVRDYYYASSNGKFTPIYDVSEVVKLSKSSAYYNAKGTSVDGAGKNGRFGEAIEEALKYLDAQGMDFSKYDYDGDGDIDNIFFFYSGYGQADSYIDTTIWPHQADFKRYTTLVSGSIGLEPLYLDGKRVGPYACSNELNFKVPAGEKQPWLDGIGAFVHEFGHVLGLPDLYDSLGTGATTPNEWSVMANGSYNRNSTCPPIFSAYEKWVCHWLDFDIAEEGQTLTVPSLTQTNRATRLNLRRLRPGYPVFDDEFFVLETRTPDSWDEALPHHGMLLWHIAFDNKLWTNNTVNTKNFGIHVSIVPPERATYHTWAPGNGTNYLNPNTANALVSTNHDDAYDKYWLSNITYNPDKGESTVEYNVKTSTTDVTTTISEVTRSEEGKTVYIVWNRVPEALTYAVSVWYIATNSKGETYNKYLTDTNGNILDNFNIGANNGVAVGPLLTAQQNAKLYVTVRVCDRYYPSDKTSAQYTFVPSSLNIGTAVEEIGAETGTITTTPGAIHAPAEAKVYNIQGLPTGRENLPAGIYIVTLGDKTVKVLVR